MSDIIGTCSLCGGRVTVPEFWGGINPPIPRCESCGARKKMPHGPVVEMERSDAPDGGFRENQQEYFGINRRRK